MTLLSLETELSCDGDLEIRLQCLGGTCGIEFHLLKNEIESNLWYSSYLNRLCLELPRLAILFDFPRVFVCKEFAKPNSVMKMIASFTEPLLGKMDFDLTDIIDGRLINASSDYSNRTRLGV